MIIVMQPDAGADQIEAVEAKIRAHGLAVHVSRGNQAHARSAPETCRISQGRLRARSGAIFKARAERSRNAQRLGPGVPARPL